MKRNFYEIAGKQARGPKFLVKPLHTTSPSCSSSLRIPWASLHAPKASVGFLWTISGVGGLVGSLVILSLGKRHRSEAILLPGLFLRGTSLIWYALMTSYAWAVPAAFLAGFGDTWISVALFSLLMERTKQGMLGRVTAFQETASALTTFLALVMVGLLKSSVFPWQFLLFCGLALCGVGMSTTLGLRGARLS